MSNFWQRTLTGIAFVAALLTCIYFQKEYFTLSALFGVFSIFGMFEFYRIANKGGNLPLYYKMALFCGLLLYFALMHCNTPVCKIGFLVYGISLMALFVTVLLRKDDDPVGHLGISILGNIYVALPFGLLTMVASYPIYWTFALFIFIWVFDTGAYLTGRAFGKHKMFERISPKKTWEGEIGGILLVLVAACIFGSLIEGTRLWQWLIYAFAIAVVGTFGDLTESMFKREAGVKDSGSLLPGHGGILDRFDSSLFAIPIAYLLLIIFGL